MKNFILKFQFPKIHTGKVNKIVGSVPISSFSELITNSELEANPRTAKTGRVTKDIEETLETSPDLFQFMSKGVLFAARETTPLERDRFSFKIEDPSKEGILDGGHNTLAIGRFILMKLGCNVDKIKNWESLKVAWMNNEELIKELKNEIPEVLVPVEVIYPSDDVNGISDFEDSILQISAARNNNAQLKETAKANQAGLYKDLKSSLPDELSDDVEWKENEGGRLKSPDLVALSLIAISVLPEDRYKVVGQIKNNPNTIFSSKGQCTKLYNEFMQQEHVSKKGDGDRAFEIIDPLVKSALHMMKDIPRLYDLIYQNFPRAYNNASPGFGRISSVRCYDPEKYKNDPKQYMKIKSKTKFYKSEVDYDYPDGFIYPLVVSLSALMEVKDNKVVWKYDPDSLIKNELSKVLTNGYQAVMNGFKFDPAKVGKEKSLYALAQNMYKMITLSNF
ncbi:AIPR family protein [Marinomonas gallaica]|uniref:AIPR family protein n=1 Tax=Marinomonas gallaica TaxID=1806667 RepID=UPI003A91CA72